MDDTTWEYRFQALNAYTAGLEERIRNLEERKFPQTADYRISLIVVMPPSTDKRRGFMDEVIYVRDLGEAWERERKIKDGYRDGLRRKTLIAEQRPINPVQF